MSELFEKSIRTLELPAVLEKLAAKAVSQAAKDRCLKLTPSTDVEEVLRLLDETDAAKERLGLHGSPSFSGVKDVSTALTRADHGGMLNTRELLDIAGVLTASRRVSDYDAQRQGEETVLDRLFASLHTNKYLEEQIRSAILDEETIADTASSELADIRRKMRLAASKGRQILQRIISSPSYAKVLQEALITQRDGRFVVPVKAECKGSMPGLVHDISSSGATLFVEPMGVVQANNELKELEAREQKEIDRILRQLSAACAAQMENILWDYDILVHLDVIFARAQLSYQLNASRPEVRRRGGVALRRARHPLLDQAKAVPITVELGEQFDTLVITGPNTGGKTVTLKTIGLLCLMAQCGLHIPADSGSAVRVFHRVLADVGDEQSIEQSLSTFSAHMSNIVQILREVDDQSLLLFDELGAGTDPIEGAALAIAIIESARSQGALIAATTHYAELKTFAMTTAGVENASCEFDVQTLRPTYHLLIGIPGKSNAFAIAGKLGLPDYIIDDAKTHLEAKDESFEDLLSSLEKSRLTIEKEQEELKAYKDEIAQLKARLTQKEERLDERKDKLLKNAAEEAQRILREAKETADQTIKQINKLSADSGLNKQLEAQRAKLREKLKEADDKLAIKAKGPSQPISPKKLKVGDGVKVLSMGLKGTVSTLPNARGDLYVQMGILRSLVNVKDLELLPEQDITGPSIPSSGGGKFSGKGRGTGSSNIKVSKSASISPEVNLIGMTVDEAMPVMEKYLDDAYLAHLTTVRVVHGRGTGALKNAVHTRLKKLKYVKEFRLGVFGEGDSGVTIVTFK